MATDLTLVKALYPGGHETALIYCAKIEGINVDFMHSKIFPWTKDAIQNAAKMSSSGVEIPVVLPEYLILYKFKAARSKDLEDIKDLLKLQGIYGKTRKLVQGYFSIEDLEDLEQLAREAEYGV